MNTDMTPEQALAIAKKLRGACVGHPNAKIPWPHRILHEAAEAIEALSRPAVPAGVRDTVTMPRAVYDMLAKKAGIEDAPGDHFRDATKMIESEERTTPEGKVVRMWEAIETALMEANQRPRA